MEIETIFHDVLKCHCSKLSTNISGINFNLARLIKDDPIPFGTLFEENYIDIRSLYINFFGVYLKDDIKDVYPDIDGNAALELSIILSRYITSHYTLTAQIEVAIRRFTNTYPECVSMLNNQQKAPTVF